MTASGLVALLLHAVLMAAASLGVLALQPAIAAALARATAPNLWQPMLDLRRLMRKRAVVAEGSVVLARSVLAGFTATAAAALLVPSFITGMTTAALSDLLVILGLLAAGRVALVLGALDTGSARSGLQAAGWMRQFLAMQVALVVAAMAIGAYAGTSNLDAALVSLRELGGPGPALILAAAAIGCIAGNAGEHPVGELSGWHRAAAQVTAALRLVVLLNLMAGLLLPGTLAPAESSVAAWLLALLAWAAKIGVLAAAVTGAEIALPRAESWYGAAALLAVLGLLFVFVGQAPA